MLSAGLALLERGIRSGAHNAENRVWSQRGSSRRLRGILTAPRCVLAVLLP